MIQEKFRYTLNSMKIILYWISWKHKGKMEKNKWHLGKITFLTVLDNFVPLTNNAFKISKEAQGYECVHPLIKVTFSAGFFFIPIICGSQNIGSNVIFLLKPRNFSWKCFCISRHNAITLQQVFGFLEEILWLGAPVWGL